MPLSFLKADLCEFGGTGRVRTEKFRPAGRSETQVPQNSGLGKTKRHWPPALCGASSVLQPLCRQGPFVRRECEWTFHFAYTEFFYPQPAQALTDI